MRSKVFPFSVILKSTLKSLIFIHPNLNYYLQCIHMTNSGTTLCALCPKQKSELRCCVAIFYFCFQFFFLKFTRSF